MLKRSKKINNSILIEAIHWLRISDKIQINNLSTLFLMIYIEEKTYTIRELSEKTNYSERSIYRNINFFKLLIETISSEKD